MELESMRQALLRMKTGGFVTPKGRETRMMRLFLETGHPLDEPVPLTEEEAVYEKSFHKELEGLQAQYDAGAFNTKSPIYSRFRMLRAYSKWLERRGTKLLGFTRNFEAMAEAYEQALKAQAKGLETADSLLEKAKKLNEEYNAACSVLPEYMVAQVKLMQDQLHSLRQPERLGPFMLWDRRPYEPLPVKASDFFPNVACTLLDIQPKAMHPALRAIGPGTNNAGDIFDMILGVMLLSFRDPIPKLLDQVWPGTAEGIMPLCGKLTDPEEGGLPIFGEAMVGARAANEGQLLQVLEEFLEWPFRPSYAELVGRLADEKLIDESSLVSDVNGMNSMMGNHTMDSF
jgi:transcription factor 1